MIDVVFSRKDGGHDLPDHDDGRVARVVVDILQPDIHGGAGVVVKDRHMIAVAGEDRLQNIKMDRTHLRRENGVAVLAHLFGKLRAVISSRTRLRLDPLLFTQTHGGKQAANTDTHRAEVVDLVDFQHGIELVAPLQDLADLIGRDRVKPAAEGIELDQLQIVALAHEFRRRIQARMVDPLIHHAERTLGIEVNRQAVLGKNIQPVGGDQLGDAVVDLGIDVVGSARQHNAGAALALHAFQNEFALSADLRLCL